jgi:hypothetical protein
MFPAWRGGPGVLTVDGRAVDTLNQYAPLEVKVFPPPYYGPPY